MQKERILAYQMAKKLEEEHLQAIHGGSFSGCGPTYTHNPLEPNRPGRDQECRWDPFD